MKTVILLVAIMVILGVMTHADAYEHISGRHSLTPFVAFSKMVKPGLEVGLDYQYFATKWLGLEAGYDHTLSGNIQSNTVLSGLNLYLDQEDEDFWIYPFAGFRGGVSSDNIFGVRSTSWAVAPKVGFIMRLREHMGIKMEFEYQYHAAAGGVNHYSVPIGFFYVF